MTLTLTPEVRTAALMVLSILVWELLRIALKGMLSIAYYRREPGDVVIRVKVLPWDKKGRKHFEAQGYTQEFPETDEEKRILDDLEK